ncbi:SET domain [Legionella lansingensis]|uniref:SET domain protein n=1 Tax=Legionella lansingensis TaxID=45067 RepID=A0A0W0VGM1_9GAMM|nr:SET domain-containing protein-lysine N-methyltransferase [Legionella lansingensis]KTD19299.1 SET domain protein [Legionella lansingensis]SNV50466.1 SET domain [Legionella lansingensis]
MVKIVLTNQHQQPSIKEAVLDLASGKVLLDKKQEVDFEAFKTFDFCHPLLAHPRLSSATNVYCYKYKDMEGLLSTAKYIYATLIASSEPMHCQFEITPSDEFFTPLKKVYRIPFSLNYRKAAKKTITVNQFNGIVSQASGFKFDFHDGLIIKDKISVKNLPPEINGDALFEENETIYELLNKPDDFETYELRYINNYIGFGVYAKRAIKKNQPVAFYLGVKTTHPELHAYYFGPKHDALLMGTDAQNYSNIARFINHAPNPDDADKQNSSLLEANLITQRHLLNGIEVVLFGAQRDIAKGEQLLIDYGTRYFEPGEAFRFTTKEDLLNANHQRLFDKKWEKLSVMRIMAQHGVSQAIYAILKRPIIALIIILLIWLLLHSELAASVHE